MIRKWMIRELRSMRHHAIVLVGSIAMGVAAMTAIHAFADAIRQGIEEQGRPLLAADIVVQSMHEFPKEVRQLKAADSSETKEMFSMVSSAGGKTLLCELKAIAGAYPLYGELQLSADTSVHQLLTDRTVVVGPTLLSRLNLKEGDQIWLNGQAFQIAGLVYDEPDRMTVGFGAGPRILLSFSGLKRSGLEDFGSRIRRKIQFKTNDVSDLEAQLVPIQSQYPNLRIQGGSQGNPTAERGVDNTERFLSIVGFLSVCIGIMGVAQSILVWLASRKAAIATYRCLGMSAGEIFAIYTGAILMLTILGAVLGLILSYLGLYALFLLFSTYLPIAVSPSLSIANIVQGFGLGIAASCIASLYPLYRLNSIPPLAAMRISVQAVPLSFRRKIVLGTALGGALISLASWQLQSWSLGLYFVLGIVGLIAILLLAALICARLLGKIQVRSWVLRHALASFRRPGLGVSASMLALGLGTLITLSIALMQARLSDQLGEVHPEKAPTAFFIDIQPDQLEETQELFRAHQGKHIQSSPVVMARLSAINDESILERVRANPEQNWAFTREQRLSFDIAIDPETIVEGDWDVDPQPNDLCLEVRYAQRWGVAVGDEVEFDIQGIPMTFRIRALRRIDWQSFNINFFLVGRAELLAEAPQFRLAAAQFSVVEEEKLQEGLIAKFPNITIVSVRAVVERLSTILESLALAVQGMGVLASSVGLLILIGSIRSSMVYRAKQFTLFRALGISRREQNAMLIFEFAIQGFVSSTIGGVAAYTLCSLLFEYLFVMPAQLQLSWVIFWICGLTILTIVVGLWSTREVLNTSVQQSLQGRS